MIYPLLLTSFGIIGWSDYLEFCASRSAADDHLTNMVICTTILRVLWPGAVSNHVVSLINTIHEAMKLAWHIICHGLPASTHNELTATRLAQYGISNAKDLDEEFGKKMIAAKMTGVPVTPRAS